MVHLCVGVHSGEHVSRPHSLDGDAGVAIFPVQRFREEVYKYLQRERKQTEQLTENEAKL